MNKVCVYFFFPPDARVAVLSGGVAATVFVVLSGETRKLVSLWKGTCPLTHSVHACLSVIHPHSFLFDTLIHRRAHTRAHTRSLSGLDPNICMSQT